jgi:hypothetical protein
MIIKENPLAQPAGPPWRAWEKVLFRFFFIFFLLLTDPIDWIPTIPGLRTIQHWYGVAVDWLVVTADAHILHIQPKGPIPTNNGSGDTSYDWATLYTFLLVAAVGCLVWSVLDRRRGSYRKLGYWFRTFLRYYIALVALGYGIIKLFGLQMSFPLLSQLATPLGDFLPMRLSWMFIGYSAPYQFFSGAMEVLTGLLLLYRKTVTFGLLLGAAVFFNVMMLNLSYDIPVKLFAIELVVSCLFLLAWDYKRLLSFLVLNRPTGPVSLYDPPFTGWKKRIAWLVFKAAFIVITVIMPFYQSRQRYTGQSKNHPAGPFDQKVYAVSIFAINKDTMPPSYADTLRWKDVIFEGNGLGSADTRDTLFRQRYRRGYFTYQTDTVHHVIGIKKSFGDSTFLMQWRYAFLDSNTIRCWTALRGDSLYLVLRRTDRHFQLAERQFHWVSEANR